MSETKNPHRGSSLNDLLEADGTYEEVSSRATMRAISENLKDKFEKSQITRTVFAKRMGSSRTVVNRLLDGKAESVTLQTLVRAANALGVRLKFEFLERGTTDIDRKSTRQSYSPNAA
jgi:antitoxin HicB